MPLLPRGSTAGPELDVRTSNVIASHFDGDAAWYHAFAATCVEQFSRDAVTGQAACDAGDLAALSVLAHNLKSVLFLLGHVELSELAGVVERHAEAGELALAAHRWGPLRTALLGYRPA